VRVALLALCLPLAGCLELYEPEVGPALHDPCVDEDSDPATDVHFADLDEYIFESDEYHCAKCHTPTGDTPIGLEVGGLDLSSAETLRAGGVRSGGAVVVPGEPCRSLIVQKVSAGPPFGARMPLDGPPFLDEEERQLLIDWIAEGAHAD
jgi:hypothetical protein